MESRVVIFFVILTLFSVLPQTTDSAPSNKFFLLSDIHLDPFYDASKDPETFCRPKSIDSSSCDASKSDAKRYDLSEKGDDLFTDYGQFGCDTPFDLMVSSFDAMRRTLPNPDFILATGDFSAHCMNSMKDSLTAIQNATATLSSFFPSAPILPLIGNNDVFPKDQIPDGPSEELEQMAAIWGPLLPASAIKSFLQGGFYTVSLRPGLRVIVLNTIFYMTSWCPNNQTECSNDYTPTTDDPANQFVFLADTLLYARKHNEQVYIAGHIGPGLSRGFNAQWRDEYQPRFMSLVSQFHDNIKGLFFGHIHRDSFGVQIDETDEETPLNSFFIGSSITPRSENNPSFRIMSYDPSSSFTITDYETYTFDLSSVLKSSHSISLSESLDYWTLEYSFSESYLDDQPLTPDQLALLVKSLSENQDEFNQWIDRWAGGSPIADSSSNSDVEYVCSFLCFNNNIANQCLDSSSVSDALAFLASLVKRSSIFSPSPRAVQTAKPSINIV